MEETRRGWPTNPLSRDHRESQRLKRQAWGLQGSMPGPLHCVMAVNLVFQGLLFMGVGVSLILLSAFGNLFFLLDCIAQFCCKGLCLVLLYLVLSCRLLSHEGLFFSNGRENTSGSRERGGGGQLGRVKGAEPVVSMCCMTEDSIFK